MFLNLPCHSNRQCWRRTQTHDCDWKSRAGFGWGTQHRRQPHSNAHSVLIIFTWHPPTCPWGHLKPATLKPVSRIFRIFRVLVSAFSAFSAFSTFLLCGISSDPCFSGVRGTVHIFRIFPLSGSNRWFRKTDWPALLWPALGDRESKNDCLREAKPGCFQTRVFPTFFGKGPDCVADPFGTVPRRCVNLHRALVSQPQKQNQPPTLWNTFTGSTQNNFVSLPCTLLRVSVHCPDSLMCPSHRT